MRKREPWTVLESVEALSGGGVGPVSASKPYDRLPTSSRDVRVWEISRNAPDPLHRPSGRPLRAQVALAALDRLERAAWDRLALFQALDEAVLDLDDDDDRKEPL